MDRKERYELESLYFDGLQRQAAELREELGEARLRHEAAARYAGEWRGEAAKVGEYGPPALRDFEWAAVEWERRAEREAAEVGKLERKLARLEEQLANFRV